MPTEPATTQMRLQHAAAFMTSATDTVALLCENIKSPTLSAISATSKSLIGLIQAVKQNKSDCALLVEKTSQLLLAISTVFVQSDTGECEMSPSMFAHVGNFTTTLHKIHAFIEAQQDGNRIKKLFRNAEMNTLLRDCSLGLQQTFDVFKIACIDLLMESQKFEELAATAQQQVLELMESLTISEGSLTSNGYSSSFRSSTSFSLLPSEPKIFHGRESELAEVLKQLVHEEAPRIAILGPGGIGKTSLARNVLHHAEISVKYAEHRFFIACDATTTRKELESLIGSHLGLQPGKDVGRQIIHHFTQSPYSLLILDNLETIWEPAATRKEIEELLSLLSEIAHLSLLITMRGAERPAGIQWTRPFLPPLQPLTLEATRNIFLDIADDAHDNKDMERILHLTDNLPLAVNLIAHAADSEGCSAVLHRWEGEKTTAISEGYDKRSSLDISISLSLSSPRFASVTGAKSLLSLLSILPDGLSEKDLSKSLLPIDNILECKAALLRTSLAYAAPANRLKVLVPVQEYIQKYHSPELELVEPLFHQYQEIFYLWKENAGTIANSEIASQIRLHLANFQSVLSYRLNQDLPSNEQSKTIYFGLDLNRFSRLAGHGAIPFMKQIPSSLPKPITDYPLEVYFISEYLWSYEVRKPEVADALIKQGFTYIPHFVHPHIQDGFYTSAMQYFIQQFDSDSAMDTMQRAISAARLSGDSRRESGALCNMAMIQHNLADYTAGLENAMNARKAAKWCGDLMKEASALSVEVLCLMALGNYQMAISQSQTARSLLVMYGNPGNDMDLRIMSILAEVHLLKSEYVQARDIYTQILDKRNQRSSWVLALFSSNLAEIESAMGVATQEVQIKIDSARQILKSAGLKKYLTACETVQAELYLRDGNIASARELFIEQLKLGWGKDSQITTFCMERLADVYRWGAVQNLFYAWPVVLLAYASKTKQRASLHKALQFLGDIVLAEGDSNTASNLLNVALEGFTDMDLHRSRAECMLRLGDIAQSQGDQVQAEELWKSAHPLFVLSSQAKQVALVDEKLATICPSESKEDTQDLVELS